MKIKVALITMIFLFAIISMNTLLAESYDHKVEIGKMEFSWKITGNEMAVKLKAKTKGWVGIGFNPETKMKGADYVVGSVKKGKVTITDEYGTSTRTHSADKKRGGKDNLSAVTGSESGGVTILEFKKVLNTGDKTDVAIDINGKTIVLLAFGPKDSFRVKHKKFHVLEMNLGDGSYKVLR